MPNKPSTRAAPRTPARSAKAADNRILDHELVDMLDDMLTAPERLRILRRAEDQLRTAVTALRDGSGRRGLATLQRQAHQLAGLAGSVGCLKITRLANAIEAASRRSHRAQIRKHLAALKIALPPALAALRHWRRRAATS